MSESATTNTRVEARLATVETSVKTIQETEVKLIERIANLEAKNLNLETRLSAIEYRDAEKSKQIEDLQEASIRAECYSRRDNLRIFGLPEKAWEKWEDTKSAVGEFFVKTLGLPEQSVNIERAHRIGGADARKPRAVIVRLAKFEHKFDILKKRGNLKGTKIRLDEDFPSIVVERRKKLLPSFHAIRQSNVATSMGEKKMVKMVIDKLHYDGEIYTHKNADTIPYPFAPENL